MKIVNQIERHNLLICLPSPLKYRLNYKVEERTFGTPCIYIIQVFFGNVMILTFFIKKVTVNLEDEHTIITQQLPTFYLWTDEQIFFLQFSALCDSKSMNRCSNSVIGKRRGVTIYNERTTKRFLFLHISWRSLRHANVA